jgi:hypothetical protein
MCVEKLNHGYGAAGTSFVVAGMTRKVGTVFGICLLASISLSDVCNGSV